MHSPAEGASQTHSTRAVGAVDVAAHPCRSHIFRPVCGRKPGSRNCRSNVPFNVCCVEAEAVEPGLSIQTSAVARQIARPPWTLLSASAAYAASPDARFCMPPRSMRPWRTPASVGVIQSEPEWLKLFQSAKSRR
jgi:hypothetical protein